MSLSLSLNLVMGAALWGSVLAYFLHRRRVASTLARALIGIIVIQVAWCLLGASTLRLTHSSALLVVVGIAVFVAVVHGYGKYRSSRQVVARALRHHPGRKARLDLPPPHGRAVRDQ